MAAIEADELVVSYGERMAVDRVSLRVEPGEIVALLGPNGAGKTTTVETLEGYRSPDAGTVRLLGRDPRREHGAVVGRIGVMLQDGGLYPALSAERALALSASYYEHPRGVGELLDLVGLTAVSRTPAKRLSGGERQRLALALALVGRPEVVFLDEPTAGIDPTGRIAVREVVTSLRSEGVAVLLTTHELDEAERLADSVTIIDRGQVVASGPLARIMSGGEEIRFAAPAGIDLAELGAVLGAEVREEPPGRYRVGTPATPRALAALTAYLAERDLALDDLRAGHQSLEEVFLALTGHGGQPEPSPAARTRRRRREALR